jgi:mannosyltransferase OCH1-like enzyme/predicted O-methyltransferase YrrM
MSVIYNKLFNKIPFCFIRFNDGEISAILSNNAVVSRGSEISSKEMSDELMSIVFDNYLHPSLYLGIPCMLCYREYYNFIVNEFIKYKSYDFNKNNVLPANILINNNYDTTFDTLLSTLKDRYVVVIAGETSITHIDRLSKLIPVSECYAVSDKYAFSKNYQDLKNLDLKNNSIVITLCGPLGRILCYQLFKNNETLTCLDLGSFFDPLIQERAYLYHTNTHKYCSECYPVGSKKYAKIFDYCKDFIVNKECYYINSIQDNFNLYNNDYIRIIQNTLIRIEKEPNNIFLYYLVLQCRQMMLFDKVKLKMESNFITDVFNIIGNNNIKNILDLEPCPSIDTVMLLECSKAFVAVNNNTTLQEYFDRSVSVDINIKYDLIYINHTYEYNQDIYQYFAPFSYVLIHNDYSNDSLINMYQSHIQNNIIELVQTKKYKSSELLICRFIDAKNITSYTQFVELYDSSNIAHKINTHVLEECLFKHLKDNNLIYSNEGYIFQIPEMFNDIIDIVTNEVEITNILDIGFLYGSSALLFLACTKANVTSVDLIYNDSVQYSENYFNVLFPDRFNFIQGNSNDITECIYEPGFDIIFIDGSHEYDTIINDIYNLIFISTEDTIFILNDVVFNESEQEGWNINPTNVMQHLMDKDVIDLLFHKSYIKGRGIAVFKIKKKDMIFTLFTKSYILANMDLLYDCKKYQTLVYIAKQYLSIYKIILTKKEYDTVLNYSLLLTKNNIPKIIHIIYINQRSLQPYNYKCIYSIIEHMKNYKIIIHNDIEPDVDEWNNLKTYNNVEIRKIDRCKRYKSLNIDYVQYETDIIRLQILYEYGGIYMDTDIFLFKNFEDILDGSSVYYNTEMKDVLTNCVLISEPKNKFIKVLLDNIHLAIQSDSWAWHIRDFPKIVINNRPTKYNVKLLKHTYFCSIHWTELKKYTTQKLEITDDMYGMHLYDTIFGDAINSFTFIRDHTSLNV